MNVLIYLVPMAIGLGLIALFAFLWALKSGQYEDIEGAALRVLTDDDVDKGDPAAARAVESPGRRLPQERNAR